MKVNIFIMAEGRNICFDHSFLRGGVVDKHFGDFSCLGTHSLNASAKFSQYHFANGSSGKLQD